MKLMLKRKYIKTSKKEYILNDIFLKDYTDALNRSMDVDSFGFWHSKGTVIKLCSSSLNTTFYKKIWINIPYDVGFDNDVNILRDQVNQEGLEVIVASKFMDSPSPSIVICLGGPIVPIPNLRESNTIYQYLMQNGFNLIIPLRRGVKGITTDWEEALDGHYGNYDVSDTIECTKYVLTKYSNLIDEEHVFLYGGSYGGYVAELIIGKANEERMYKAVIAHCGIYDLAGYPWHNQGNPKETMLTYGGTTNQEEYADKVLAISPKSYIDKWNVPMLLIHHIYDMSSWFGQSVIAYNDAIQIEKQVQLLLVPGPHSYDIKYRNELFQQIVSFYTELILKV